MHPLSLAPTLPQVSVSGSVVVEKLMEIERYSHVMHISSTVTGTKCPLSVSRITQPNAPIRCYPTSRPSLLGCISAQT